MCRGVVQLGAIALVLVAAASSSHGQTTPATSSATSAPVAESEAASSHPLPVRFGDVLRVELKDRRLNIVMTPPPTLDADMNAGRSIPVTITDSDDSDWRLSGSSGGRGADGSHARFAVAPPYDMVPDRWSPLRLTKVTRDERTLTITGVGRVARNTVTVNFTQEQPLNAVRLTVNRSRRAGLARPLHDFGGADLLTLWNEHQREVRMYLVPLLRTIQPRENLLRPRAGDVYRVFADIPADAEVIKRLAAMLPELESASPAAREAASRQIEALGGAGVLALLRMDRSEWTPEQSARLSGIVQDQSTLADPLAWRKDIYFLTDCLDDPDPAVRRSALSAARAIAGHDVDFDVDAAPEARLAASQDVLRTLEAATGR
jgi:hypothetical protein